MTEAVHFWERVAQWSEIIGGLAFIVVAIWMFRKWVLPFIVRTTERKNAEILDAEKYRDELRGRVEVAHGKIAEADREAVDIGSRAVNDAQLEHEAILNDGRRQGTLLLQNANGELERARFAARTKLRIEFIEKALVRAREIARERVDDSVNAQLVRRTVDELTSPNGRGGAAS